MGIKQILAAFTSSMLVAVSLPLAVSADSSTVLVTPSNMQGWTTAAPPADNRPVSSVTFTDEFGAPAGFGAGSLKLTTSDGSGKAQIAHAAPDGTKLSEVTSLGYSTYRSSSSTGAAGQVAAINLPVDTNGSAAGGFTTLVFEPIYQSGGAAAITNDTWQNWEASGNAIWWSTHDLIDSNGSLIACNPNGALASAPQCAGKLYVPLSTIVAAFPDTTVAGYLLNQGSGNPGIVSGVDKFIFGDTTYNFEPSVRLSDKDACKNGGWQTSNDPVYKNQGDCVSDFASNGKAKGNPSTGNPVTNFFKNLF